MSLLCFYKIEVFIEICLLFHCLFVFFHNFIKISEKKLFRETFLFCNYLKDIL